MGPVLSIKSQIALPSFVRQICANQCPRDSNTQKSGEVFFDDLTVCATSIIVRACSCGDDEKSMDS